MQRMSGGQDGLVLPAVALLGAHVADAANVSVEHAPHRLGGQCCDALGQRRAPHQMQRVLRVVADQHLGAHDSPGLHFLDKRHYQDPDFRGQSSPFLLAWVQRLVRAP